MNASCARCGHDTAAVHGCIQGVITLSIGGSLPRVLSDGRDCPCGVDGEAVHHEGCPMEVCPWCGDYLVNCQATACIPTAA